MGCAVGGRSGTRGDGAQPCRRRSTLVDRGGNPVRRDRHLLSLRDLNLSDNIEDLLDAGITAFKIEGRLKDRAYIVNVVSWYRRQLDRALAARGWARSSSGHSTVGFEPDVTKTFNRGFTRYFIEGRKESPGGIESPKMVGEPVGVVTATRNDSFVLDTQAALRAGDGLCWFGPQNDLMGTLVNAVQQAPTDMSGVRVVPADMSGIRKGLRVYRNQDHAFLREVERSRPTRKIAVRLRLGITADGLELTAEDEDGNVARRTLATSGEPALKPEQATETARKQLGQTGNTPFESVDVELAWDQPYFVRVSELNALRRETLDELLHVRAAARPVMRGEIQRNDAPFPEKVLDYRGNVLNDKARQFYLRHGVQEIGPAAESGLDMRGKVVMRTRYCLKHQLGLCDGKRKPSGLREPLYLVDEDGHRYRLRFNCQDCEMEIEY